MAKRIVLATIGSLGDLHPFLAVGKALQVRGASVLLAVPESYRAKTEAAGFEACTILPSFESLGDALGISPEEASRRIMSNPDFLFRHVMLPTLSESTRILDAACAGADMILGSMFATCAALVAEKRKIPFVPVLLQPLMFVSPRDPPRTRNFFLMARYPASGIGLAWNRVARKLVMMEMNRRYGARVDAVRAEHGLPPSDVAPGFESENTPPLSLALYPRLLGPDDRETTRGAVFTGFTHFDSEGGGPPVLDAETEAFLRNGEPPLAFTLGSLAVFSPGQFFKEARKVAALMGRRAILIGEPTGAPSDARIHSRPYAPYSLVFARCAAVIHQGGIGTTGQVLSSGKPHLVVPHMADQSDNGTRIERLGVGRMLPVRRFRADRAAALLGPLLADGRIAARAREVQALMGDYEGGGRAADALLKALA